MAGRGKIGLRKQDVTASYLRNFVFGVEDSLVSTVGLLSGIAIANVPRDTILLTGVVLIFVEAFSMGAGSFMAEYSAEGFIRHRDARPRRSFIAALIMFCSYLVAGLVPLSPYAFLSAERAFGKSIFMSLVALFVLGLTGARFSRINLLKNALRMMVIGGGAIAIGVIVGRILTV